MTRMAVGCPIPVSAFNIMADLCVCSECYRSIPELTSFWDTSFTSDFLQDSSIKSFFSVFFSCSVLLSLGTWLKRHHAFLCVVFVWLYAGFWATMPLVGWGNYAPEPFGTSCTLDWWLAQASISGQTFVMAILFFCLILPTGIIVFSYVMIIFKVKSSAKEISNFDARIRNSHNLEMKLTKVGERLVRVGMGMKIIIIIIIARQNQICKRKKAEEDNIIWSVTSLCHIPGGNADLCWLPDSLDPLCSGVRGVSVWYTRIGAHTRFCHSHIAGQVFSHVQPYHLPGRGSEKFLLEIFLFQAFQEVKVQTQHMT